MSQEYSRPQVLDIIEAEALKRHIPKDDFLRFADIETGGRFDVIAHGVGKRACGRSLDVSQGMDGSAAPK